MKILQSLLSIRGRLLAVAGGCFLLLPLPSRAFPPAPYHIIYGEVRDEYGLPLAAANAQILFEPEPTNGVQITSSIVANLEPGVNYRLNLSMDSGISPDLYKGTALKSTVPFRIRVKIDSTTYLPLEMSGNYVNLGKPAESTRLDLTLGVDANHDGIPDAWQQLLSTMLPGADTSPNADPDGDGISNLNEYLAGTYAWEAQEGLKLSLVRAAGAGAMLSKTDVVGTLPQRFYRVILVQSPTQPVAHTVTLSGGIATIMWSGVGGQTYRVQYKNSLTDASWTDLPPDVATGGPVLQFFGLAGRTYTILGTTNLVDWSPVSFRVPVGSDAAPVLSEYYAPSSESIEAEVLFQPPHAAFFFRMQVR